ncbi:MAG: aspartate aminotransferase family protein [SAR202 cluster bacterium]|nr:aspartate aminotransferase family protein [SAR202 cluster bacterium]
MTNATDWKAIEAKYYMQVVRRRPLVLVRGEGTKVFDDQGREFLDFTAGWAVLNLGHAHPAVTAAIRDQAGQIMQMSNLYYTTPQLKLAQILIDHSCFDRIFFANSGAEANEGASKLARKYGKQRLNGAHEIITTFNSFHGRTQAMMAATGQPHYQENWKPLMPGFVNVEYNNIDAIKRATTDKTCAVLVEPVQGEGGVNVPAPDYLKKVQAWCKEKKLLFMVDEVQTGMGRLGTLFGYQQFGVEPDVMTLAKALGAGAPLGAFLCKQEFSVLEPGDHGSTFGGNALTTAAGWAAAKVMVDENIPAKAARTGVYFMGKLAALKEKHSFVRDVRGMGLLIGFELADNRSAALMQECEKNGLLVNSVRPNTIRFMPPLTVSNAEIDRAVEIFDRALSTVPAPKPA